LIELTLKIGAFLYIYDLSFELKKPKHFTHPLNAAVKIKVKCFIYM